MQKRLRASDVSLDAPIFLGDGESGGSYGDTLADEGQASLEEFFLRSK